MKKTLLLLISILTLTVYAEPGKSSWLDRTKQGAALATKIALQLKSELEELGINSADIIAEAKKNPAQFRVAVPEHHRKRFIVFSREHERIIADAFLEEMKKQGKLYTNAADEARVRSIAEKITTVLPEKIPVKIYLVKDETVNAFCLIDGSVFVHSGLLRTLKDDNQLAAVIAHEYGHAAARHGAENLTKLMMKSAGAVYMSEVAKKNEQAGKKTKGFLIKLGYGLGSEIGVFLPYQRTMEYEADKLGVLFMSKAGFDPHAMVDLFETFEKLSPDQDSPWNLLSTHPVHKKRIDHVKTVLQECCNK